MSMTYILVVQCLSVWERVINDFANTTQIQVAANVASYLISKIQKNNFKDLSKVSSTKRLTFKKCLAKQVLCLKKLIYNERHLQEESKHQKNSLMWE